jgi:hypothetical protein
MFLVELVMQGVRGIHELARLRFQSGFNFIVAGNEAGKTTAVDSALRMLFPSGDPDRMHSLVSRHAPDASRAAAVAYSDDGAYYRVIEDFSKRGVNLSKYNAATKEFSLIYKDWDNTVQFMAGLTGEISEGEYASVFVFRREDYTGQTAPSFLTEASPQPATRRAPAPQQQVSPAREARLAELRADLRKAEDAADAEYKLQSGKLRLEEIRKKIGGAEGINQRYADIDANLETLKNCTTLPENLGEIIDQHEQRQGQKMTESEELAKEIEGVRMHLDAMPGVNLTKDPLFIGGVVVAALSVLAALFVLTAEQADYFPLGILLAAALIVVGWYRGTRKSHERKVLQKEIDGLEAEREALEKSFEQGGSEIMACMQTTGSVTTAELKEKAENYRYFLSLRSELDEQRTHLQGEVTPEDLQAEYDRQQQEVLELEKAAQVVAQYNVDTYAFRQEIERLESEAAGGAVTDFSFGEPEPIEEFSFSAPVLPAGGPAGFFAELETASRIGGIEMETLLPAVEAAAQRNLAAVTNGRYVRIEAGQEGPPIVHAQDDSAVPVEELSHGTRDVIYFCLRTALVEALAGKRRLPFLLDDPLAGFDPARQQAACQILRALGAKTQVILFASNPALRAAGDVTAELK